MSVTPLGDDDQMDALITIECFHCHRKFIAVPTRAFAAVKAFRSHVPCRGGASDEERDALKAMRDADVETLATVSDLWPNITRDHEHRALEASDRLGRLLNLHPRQVWAGFGLPTPSTRSIA